MRMPILPFSVFLLTWPSVSTFVTVAARADDSPRVELGERLFKEGRFSQPHFANASPRGVRGPQLWSCATCHHLPEQKRGYADSESRSPVPARREDQQQITLRNSPSMIDLFFNESSERPNLLHYDGEFASPEDLVRAGLTGRNLGWLAHEKSIVVAHIATVVRREFADDEETFGLSLLLASDSQILDAVADLISDYMRSLEFEKDDEGQFSGSPYDRFLARNRLPQRPNPGETGAAYTLRLLESVERLSNPEWVDEGRMRRHEQDFRFGPTELQGMKIFLKSGPRGSIRDFAHLRGIGNCASCHTPPAFTDFTFRNTGVSQEEYDAIHGRGGFLRMAIPSLVERLQMDSSRLADFAALPSYQNTRAVDLGAWNQLQPGVRGPLFGWICQVVPGCSSAPSEQAVQDAAIAAFKTPTVRNLGHSAPYLHNGSRPTIESATLFYAIMSNLARDGRMRNADPEMLKVFLDGRDVGPLAAFMRALNEEYE